MTRIYIYLHCFPANLPKSLSHSCAIYGIVGQAFVFPVDTIPFPVLSAILSRLFHFYIWGRQDSPQRWKYDKGLALD
jgi:hypothetical protein